MPIKQFQGFIKKINVLNNNYWRILEDLKKVSQRCLVKI